MIDDKHELVRQIIVVLLKMRMFKLSERTHVLVGIWKNEVDGDAEVVLRQQLVSVSPLKRRRLVINEPEFEKQFFKLNSTLHTYFLNRDEFLVQQLNNLKYLKRTVNRRKKTLK